MVGQRQGLRLHHHRWAGAGCAHSESKEPPSRLAHAGFPAAAAGQPGHKPAQKCRRVLLSGTSSHRSAVSDRCSSTIATSTPLASAAWPRESPWSSSWGRSKRPARWRRPLLHTRPEVLAPHDRCAPLPSSRPQHSRSLGPTAPLYKVARRRGPTHGIEAATTSTDHEPHANADTHARNCECVGSC